MDKMYLSKIVHVDNGVNKELYIKDAEAREAISALEAYSDYIGVTTTALTDGATTNPVVINSENVTAKKGNIVNYGSKEFIFNGTAWQEFGDLSALGALAYEDTAVGSVTAAGTNSSSAVSFAEHTTGSFLTGIDTAAIAPSFTEGTFSAGTLPSKEADEFSAGSLPSFTEGAFSAGTLPSLGSATTSNFATEGVTATYTENDETLTLGTASTSAAVTAQGTFSAGTLPSKVADTWSAGSLPSFTEGSFSAGTLPSKAADTFSAGSAATFSTGNALTALGAATAAAQTFTGSAVSVTVAPAA